VRSVTPAVRGERGFGILPATGQSILRVIIAMMFASGLYRRSGRGLAVLPRRHEG
jgi:hypothetical protein